MQLPKADNINGMQLIGEAPPNEAALEALEEIKQDIGDAKFAWVENAAVKAAKSR